VGVERGEAAILEMFNPWVVLFVGNVYTFASLTPREIAFLREAAILKMFNPWVVLFR